MNSIDKSSKKEQSVQLCARKTLSIEGVCDVISFDETLVALSMEDCVLSVDGEGMRVVRMDVESGDLVLEGKINALTYSDKRIRKSGLFGKK